MCIFHKWSKWDTYTDFVKERRIGGGWILSSGIEIRQQKRCKKCGKIKDKLVRTKVL